jgi:uncharacterized Zn finger protein (UPF0148 family)
VKKATYKNLKGEKFTIEYDENAPCWSCGKPVVEASMGGTAICPWCDTGYNRDGTKTSPQQIKENAERYKRNTIDADLKTILKE